MKWNNLNLATTFVTANKVTAVISTSLLATPVVGVIKVSGTHATYGSLTTTTRNVVVRGNVLVYLPLIAYNFKLTPNAPVLLAISNPAGANAYSVVWNPVPGATSYTLQEDDNASFSSPTTAYSGANTSQAFASKPVGTYYYRVTATNAYGNSAWSATQSTAVAGAVVSLPNGNFESGATVWAESSSNGFLLITSCFANLCHTAHSGSWAVWLGGAVNETAYIQQQVTVPAGSPYLAYYHLIGSARRLVVVTLAVCASMAEL